MESNIKDFLLFFLTCVSILIDSHRALPSTKKDIRATNRSTGFMQVVIPMSLSGGCRSIFSVRL